MVGRAYALGLMALVCGLLQACNSPAGPASSSASGPGPASPSSPTSPAPPAPPNSPATVPIESKSAAPAGTLPTPIRQPASRWVPVAFEELPGLQDDRLTLALPALGRQCTALPTARPAGTAWDGVCRDLQTNKVGAASSDQAMREWLTTRFQAYRVEGLDGQVEGLATGYFEPMFDASRSPTSTMRHPVHRPPADIATRKPWATREQADNDPQVRAQLQGREIAYLADPLDVLMLQIQGSGRLRIVENDGRVNTVRLAFAAHNDQPYQSVGRWLIQRGELRSDEASWQGIRQWAKRNPTRLREMLHANPRLVFFQEEPLRDASEGPRGAQGVPLTAERSIAVDPRSIPYGTAVWIDTIDPSSQLPLRRLVMAQDTGGAIVGAVRADYFWGFGDKAEQQASRMKHRVRMWALVPKGQAAPLSP